jgi:hypothetical protein
VGGVRRAQTQSFKALPHVLNPVHTGKDCPVKRLQLAQSGVERRVVVGGGDNADGGKCQWHGANGLQLPFEIGCLLPGARHQDAPALQEVTSWGG